MINKSYIKIVLSLLNFDLSILLNFLVNSHERRLEHCKVSNSGLGHFNLSCFLALACIYQGARFGSAPNISFFNAIQSKFWLNQKEQLAVKSKVDAKRVFDFHSLGLTSLM